jgi:hypothetical protein
MKENNRVKGVRPLGDYRLRVIFNDGYIGDVDLQALVEHATGPIVEPLKDPDFFQKAQLDLDTVAWPNGYDICPDVLRFFCELGRVASREEIAAHFNSVNASRELVLNDKPAS